MTHQREYIVNRLREIKGRRFKALMGDGTGRVEHETKANYVWIRPKYGSAIAPPVSALNRHIPPEDGRVVVVQEIKAKGIKGYEVVELDAGILYYTDTTEQQPLPKHGSTHECRQDAIGSDPVNLYTRGWAELRVEAVDPAALYCYVTRGWYLFDIPRWFDGGNTPTFATGPGPRYDLVYLDSSGTIGIEQGQPPMLAPDPLVPEPPTYTIPLAAIYLETGTVGSISESEILDCRIMPNVKEPILFDDGIAASTVQSALPSWTGDSSYPARANHRHGITGITQVINIPDNVGTTHHLTFTNGVLTTYTTT